MLMIDSGEGLFKAAGELLVDARPGGLDAGEPKQ
jgi:hypothetical protein